MQMTNPTQPVCLHTMERFKFTTVPSKCKILFCFCCWIQVIRWRCQKQIPSSIDLRERPLTRPMKTGKCVDGIHNANAREDELHFHVSHLICHASAAFQLSGFFSIIQEACEVRAFTAQQYLRCRRHPLDAR